MFSFIIGLVDDIMLQEVDVVVKQTSKLEKISIKLDSSLQKCKFLFERQDRMLTIAAQNLCEGKHWKNDLSLKDSFKVSLS